MTTFKPGDVVTGKNKTQVGVVIAVETDAMNETVYRVSWNTGGEVVWRAYRLTPIERHIDAAMKKVIEMQVRADRARSRYASVAR